MTAIPAPNKKKTTLVSWINQENVAGYMFSLPFIFGFLMFMVIPMGLSLFYSFCKYDIQNPPVWIGLENYIKIFTSKCRYSIRSNLNTYFRRCFI